MQQIESRSSSTHRFNLKFDAEDISVDGIGALLRLDEGLCNRLVELQGILQLPAPEWSAVGVFGFLMSACAGQEGKGARCVSEDESSVDESSDVRFMDMVLRSARSAHRADLFANLGDRF